MLDTTGKRSGRGAYICKKVSCLSKARRSGRITSALEVQIPEEVFAKMEEELAVGR